MMQVRGVIPLLFYRKEVIRLVLFRSATDQAFRTLVALGEKSDAYDRKMSGHECAGLIFLDNDSFRVSSTGPVTFLASSRDPRNGNPGGLLPLSLKKLRDTTPLEEFILPFLSVDEDFMRKHKLSTDAEAMLICCKLLNSQPISPYESSHSLIAIQVHKDRILLQYDNADVLKIRVPHLFIDASKPTLRFSIPKHYGGLTRNGLPQIVPEMTLCIDPVMWKGSIEYAIWQPHVYYGDLFMNISWSHHRETMEVRGPDYLADRIDDEELSSLFSGAIDKF